MELEGWSCSEDSSCTRNIAKLEAEVERLRGLLAVKDAYIRELEEEVALLERDQQG